MDKQILKIITILSISFTFITFVFGQNNDQIKPDLRKNIIDIAVGGSGQVLSLNYNRILSVKSKYFISSSIGIGTAFFRQYHRSIRTTTGMISYPHQISFNFGNKSSFFEVGLGGVFMKEKFLINDREDSSISYFLAPIIGFRQYLFNRILLKVFATPNIKVYGDFTPDIHFTSYLGVSLGYFF